jgi:acid stress-induced BolA-like protein IbaG/YrbA
MGKAATRKRSRTQIKKILSEALRQEFPHDTVDVSDGYKENIHVVVVSRSFDEMGEREKQQVLWRVIDRTELTEEEKQLISLVYPVSIRELK